MIRISEVVLPGHPDKFCDLLADAIVAEAHRSDPATFCQVEASTWSDEVFLTGTIVTRAPLTRPLEAIVRATGRAIGYVAPNHIVADRYRVHDAVCQHVTDPRAWSGQVDDQCIAIGWAGYDARVGHLPPEHWLARRLGHVLETSCRGGLLRGQGPDGKLLLRLRENAGEWCLEHLLVTLQQLPDIDFGELVRRVVAELRRGYESIRGADRRWVARFDDVEVLVNPNGPLLNGGSDGDNGQTGRKLVMDYYGPRVPIGGGALAGKHHAHIDRVAARAARAAALHAVQTGASQCQVMLAYAPNRDLPLDVVYDMHGRGERRDATWFGHAAIVARGGAVSHQPAALPSVLSR